ncbi:MAG: hemolysin III family protein [Ruminococcaceae bacterium]|nr:hemolysin III family protein [Oscillospiraceae bacterium]
MTRTKLKDRLLPNYTHGEEVFNMVSHIVGGGIGVVALVLCVLKAALFSDAWAVVGSAVYGVSLIALYTMSGVYHGLHPSTAKKVLQVLDHCTIYFLIAGTYTPILLSGIRPVSAGWAWTLFGIVWGLAAIATVFTAIDLKKYAVFSMACYIGMGWCIVLAARVTMEALSAAALWLLLLGGIAYTVGAVLYGLGKKHRYMHGVFHLFVLVGSVLQLLCILIYVI